MRKLFLMLSLIVSFNVFADDFNAGVSGDFTAGGGDYAESNCVMINGQLVCR